MSKLKIILETYKLKGLYGIKRLIIKKYFVEKVKPIKGFNEYKLFFENKVGIEIGGLSQIFKNEIPIYPIIKNVDGCNFSSQTVWEGQVQEGNNYNFFDSKNGYQYICEASNLNRIPSEKYDFIISSHCLEHCANTLKTVKEWLRVVKKGGVILLVLPDKRHTFDRNRPVTKFSHLLDDYTNEVNENDLTHLSEILELHDLSLDEAAGSIDQFKKRSLDNYNNRCLHHHVFDFELLKQIFEYNNVKTVNTTFVKPYHQIILGIKK
jgi:SAM-dependent methyltransferase